MLGDAIASKNNCLSSLIVICVSMLNAHCSSNAAAFQMDGGRGTGHMSESTKDEVKRLKGPPTPFLLLQNIFLKNIQATIKQIIFLAQYRCSLLSLEANIQLSS